MLQTCSLEETEVRGDRWRLRAASQNLQSWSPHSACWRTESVKLQGGLLCRAGGRPTVLPQLLTGTAFPSSPWAAYKCLSGVFPFIWEEGKKQCYSAPFPSVLCSSHLSHLLFFFFPSLLLWREALWHGDRTEEIFLRNVKQGHTNWILCSRPKTEQLAKGPCSRLPCTPGRLRWLLRVLGGDGPLCRRSLEVCWLHWVDFGTEIWIDLFLTNPRDFVTLWGRLRTSAGGLVGSRRASGHLWAWK